MQCRRHAWPQAEARVLSESVEARGPDDPWLQHLLESVPFLREGRWQRKVVARMPDEEDARTPQSDAAPSRTVSIALKRRSGVNLALVAFAPAQSRERRSSSPATDWMADASACSSPAGTRRPFTWG